MLINKKDQKYVIDAVKYNPAYMKYLESNKNLTELWNRILRIRD